MCIIGIQDNKGTNWSSCLDIDYLTALGFTFCCVFYLCICLAVALTMLHVHLCCWTPEKIAVRYTWLLAKRKIWSGNFWNVFLHIMCQVWWEKCLFYITRQYKSGLLTRKDSSPLRQRETNIPQPTWSHPQWVIAWTNEYTASPLHCTHDKQPHTVTGLYVREIERANCGW